ncbi:CBS domain-containing protein [Gracilibacillus ureilyticus]|uniref:CBS domain-containing protein n=1 Tax=Gracilibacillus ureilyticus TaxID=531814 RepID=A0A1H9T3G5_9BACI|nr:CBS domain-containing protein [Gracilibacillus ureilyticus]SER91163.1 CBS domain-containing protein [Gracilibacillus ureilyticus]
MKTVRDVMTEDIAICRIDDSIGAVAQIMKERNIGAVPVCENSQDLLGMVTDRDLVIRGYAENRDAAAPVKEVMSDMLYKVQPEATLLEASQMMADYQIRRLPVVNQGKLIGMLSLGDLSLDQMSDTAAGRALEEISEHTNLPH